MSEQQQQQQHPMEPSPEIVNKLFSLPLSEKERVAAAYRAGADQELEACCEWLERRYNYPQADHPLRAARRPKPPSLAEEALMGLEQTVIMLMPVTGRKKIERFAIIRRALERLQELEKGNE